MNFSTLADVEANILHSDIEATTTSVTILSNVNTIDQDPLFVDAMGSDWNLQDNSPCIDTGVDVGLPFFDAAPEMGAFEIGSCIATSASLEVTSCDSYTYNGDVLEVSGTYNYVYTNAAGCDSTVMLSLIIETLSPEITSDGMTLTAFPAGASYQWIDCASNDPPIAGATGETFTPTVSGTYAVEITDGACTKTSDCVAIMVTSVKENLFEGLSYAPNPVEDVLQINFGENQESLSLMLTDLSGKQINSQLYNNTNTIIVEAFNLPKGLYFITIQSEAKRQSIKFVKH